MNRRTFLNHSMLTAAVASLVPATGLGDVESVPTKTGLTEELNAFANSRIEQIADLHEKSSNVTDVTKEIRDRHAELAKIYRSRICPQNSNK